MSNYKHERGWLDSMVFENKPYDERSAWSWMIGEAAFKDRVVPDDKKLPVRINRGQFTASLRFMAQKWQWDKDRVRRFLKRLEKWQMIAVATVNATQQNVITICNYNKYQITSKESATQNATVPRQSRDKQEVILSNSSKEEEPPDGAPPQLHFDGTVVRLTERDWLAWLAEFSLTEGQLGDMLCERDDFLRKLPESDNRRSRWWIPTRKWLATETENLKRSI